MASLPSRAHLRGALAGLLATLLCVGLSLTALWQRTDERAREGLQRLTGLRPISGDLVVVSIGETTSQVLGGAVPRTAHARVLEALTRAGAQAVVYDVPLTQEGRDGPDGTLALAAAAKGSGRALLPVLCDQSPQLDAATIRARLLPRALEQGLTPGRSCPGALTPQGPLSDASALGHVELGVRVPLFVDVLGMRIPSVGLAAYAKARELPLSGLGQEPWGVRAGRLELPVNAQGELPVRTRALAEAETLPFPELLAGIEDTAPPTLPPYLVERLKGRVVLLSQLWAGPHHAASWERTRRLASHLSDLLDERVPRGLSSPQRSLLVLLLGLVGTALGLWARSPRLACGVGAGLGVGGMALTWGLGQAGLFVGPLAPSLVGALAVGSSFGVFWLSRSLARRQLSGLFGPYVAPEQLERILSQPEARTLEAQEREVTVLYCDLGGVGPLVGTRPAQEVLAAVHAHLSLLSAEVMRRGGRVEKVLGDGLLAVFGDPLEDERHAPHAVEAGLAMLEVARRLSQEAPAPSDTGPRIRLALRVGVASGPVVAGDLGGVRGKPEYGVVGPAVQLAVKLEGRAPAGAVLVSARTRALCTEGFDVLEVPSPLLRGSSLDGNAYLVVGQRLEFDPERKSARLWVDSAQVRVHGRGVVGSGRVMDVGAHGMRVRADVALSPGDKVEVEFASGRAPGLGLVRVTGEVRHAEEGPEGSTTIGMTVDRAETPGTAPHVFAALFLGAQRLDPELGLHTRTGEVFAPEGEALVRRG